MIYRIIFFLFFTIQLNSLVGEKKIIVGEFSWHEWKDNCEWISFDTTNYEPINEIILDIIELKNKNNYFFYLFAGSWCGDSESELPKIKKIFKDACIEEKNLRIFGVDRDKDEPSHFSKMMGISKVPTLVITNNFHEIGRIIEYPINLEKRWEIDLLEIMKKE